MLEFDYRLIEFTKNLPYFDQTELTPVDWEQFTGKTDISWKLGLQRNYRILKTDLRSGGDGSNKGYSMLLQKQVQYSFDVDTNQKRKI